jgi:hypothetical protein
MSSLSKTVMKNQQKLAYAKFSKAWRAEQRYQNSIIAKDGKLPDDVKRLRRKPTFRMWLEITRTYQAQQTAQPIEVQEFVEETSLDWDEEEPKAPGDAPSEGQTEVQGQHQR